MTQESDSTKLVSDWIQRLDVISSKVEFEFSELNASQLNWKTSQNSWSIGQCLLHLVVSNEKYFPILDALNSGKFKASFWQKINPLSSYTGRKMAESLGAKIIKPFVAPKLFDPGKSAVRSVIIADFIKHQELLKSKISNLKNQDFQKTIVSSPVAPLITFPLKDCIEILIGHEERHLAQALLVKENPGLSAL